ncbi:MAG: hypothetical protein Q8O55_00020 [Dehalococcoidales bacterium]|nr:hypothetical protein [Dehalococcoidales bacterium]
MKKVIWLGVLMAVVIVAYFIAGYFMGNLPVASRLLGTNQPRDLGIELSVDNAFDGLSSLNHPLSTADLQAIIDNPGIYTTVKTTITDEQASSLISTIDFPVKLVQIKFGPGGSVESSGIINISQFQDLMTRAGASSEVINTVMDYVSKMDWAIYYVSGQFGISNNQVSLDVDKLEIGRIVVPESLQEQLNDNMGSVERYISNVLTAQGYNIREMSVTDGQIRMDMDRPLSSLEPWLKFVQ